MSRNTTDDWWDFYFCQIDGKPHSTMVNLSLRKEAPIAGQGIFQCIEVPLIHPNPKNGMTTNEEFQQLSDLEDLVLQSESKDLRYVARQTGDSQRKFYFYSKETSDIDTLLDSIGHSFPQYETQTFSFKDRKWETYLEDLYPNAMGMNEITNRQVLDKLEANGDDLDVPREVDHSVVFGDRQQAEKYEAIVTEKGFSVKICRQGLLKRTYDLLAQRVDAPSQIDPVTFELEQLAEGLGGSYDGWGCVVVVSQSKR